MDYCCELDPCRVNVEYCWFIYIRYELYSATTNYLGRVQGIPKFVAHRSVSGHVEILAKCNFGATAAFRCTEYEFPSARKTW